MKTTHTPWPWKNETGTQYITNSAGILVATAATPDDSCAVDWEDTYANARAIVRACNSHYELLAALEGMIGMARFETDSTAWIKAAILAESIVKNAKD